MTRVHEIERVQTVVIGAGQAGLSVGYYLQKHNLPFVILDANARVGDSWRKRWDSLRLFTPARFDGLPGMPFPAAAHAFPSKDEMGDYLEAYASQLQLPVRTGIEVERLSRAGDSFFIEAGEKRFEAENVVVAMANFQIPRVPDFASQLDASIVQLHSSNYRNPSQMRDGGVLIVGSGNSGAELAMELSRTHPVWLSGNSTGQIPFRVDGAIGRFALRPLFRFVFHRVLTVGTPIGRKLRPKVLAHGGPLIRVKAKDLAAAGVQRVARTAGVKDGLPMLEDGQVIEAENVLWCTGFQRGFDWIDLPILEEMEPLHERGIVSSQPGLFFVGLEFLYSLSSVMIHGVGRDAERIADAVAVRASHAAAVSPSAGAVSPSP